MKKYNLFKIATFLLFFLMFSIISCKKNDSPEPTIQTTNPFVSGSNISTNFSGVVIDENDNPMSNVTITIGNKTISTNSKGGFVLTNVSVDSKFAKITAEKSGYFKGMKSITPSLASNFNIIKLLQKNNLGSFSSSTGGTVVHSSGATVNFNPNSIQIENGGEYSGQVEVSATYIDPTSDDLFERMPGNLQAVNSIGESRILQSFGMIGVELTGSNGEALNISEGNIAVIKIPVPASILSNAPSTIPLWHFDENLGIWVEDGEANLVDNEYIGTVSHFSFWNCDAPFPIVELTGKVETTNGNPVIGVKIQLTFFNSSGQAVGCDYSDNNGCFGGAIPQGEVLYLEIYDRCGNIIHSGDIGPFSDNVSLPAIVANTSNSIISGTLVDCNGVVIPDGDGIISLDLGYMYDVPVYIDVNGNFSYTYNDCAGGSQVEVIGYDFINIEESTPQTFTSVNGVINTGNISTCNAIENYIDFSLDGGALTTLSFYAEAIDSVSYVTLWGEQPTTGFFIIVVDNPAVGTFTASSVKISTGGVAYNSAFGVDTDVMVTFTAYDTVNNLATGTYTGTFVDTNGVVHTISGSFNLPIT